MQNRSRGLLVMALIALMTTSAFCEKVKISYYLWATKEGINTVSQTVAKFNQTHDNISVDVYGVDPTVYWEKLNAFFASNTPPDVIQVAADYGDAFISRGVFEPLDSFVAADPQLKSKWPKTIVDSLSVNSKLYSLPIGTQVYFIAYNKSAFKAAGLPFPKDSWTEQDFLNTAKKLTDPSKKQYGVLVTGYPRDLARDLYGKYCYDASAKKMQAAGNEAFSDALTFLTTELFAKSKVTPASVSTKSIGGGFETGKYPMAFIAYWDIASLAKTIGNKFDWDIVRYPVSTKYDTRWKSPLYVQALSISAQSKNKEAAFEFCKWMSTNKAAQTSMSDSFPVCTDVTSDPSFLKDFSQTNGKAYSKKVVIDTIAEQGIGWWNAGVVGEINDNVINPEIEKLILQPEKTSVAEAIATIQDKGQKIFDRK